MNTEHHLSARFDAELDSIRSSVTRMGGLVERQVAMAIAAYSQGDGDLIQQVLHNEDEVDLLEVAINKDCTEVIARRQPAAVDLRLIMAVSRLVSDLERIGDEARKIAKMSRRIHEQTPLHAPRLPEIHEAGDLCVELLHKVLDAFVRGDTDVALQVVREDKLIDEKFKSIIRLLITYMMEDPRTIAMAIDIVFIAKAIERIGDHAKNIAEQVIYISSGEDVRHTKLGKTRTDPA